MNLYLSNNPKNIQIEQNDEIFNSNSNESDGAVKEIFLSCVDGMLILLIIIAMISYIC